MKAPLEMTLSIQELQDKITNSLKEPFSFEKETLELPSFKRAFEEGNFRRIVIEKPSENPLSCSGKLYLQNCDTSFEVKLQFLAFKEKLLGFNLTVVIVPISQLSLFNKEISFLEDSEIPLPTTLELNYQSNKELQLTQGFRFPLWDLEIHGLFPLDNTSEVVIGAKGKLSIDQLEKKLPFFREEFISAMPDALQTAQCTGFQLFVHPKKITLGTIEFSFDNCTPLHTGISFFDLKVQVVFNRTTGKILGGALHSLLSLGTENPVEILCSGQMQKDIFSFEGHLQKELTLDKLPFFKDLPFTQFTINRLDFSLEHSKSGSDVACEMTSVTDWALFDGLKLTNLHLFARLYSNGQKYGEIEGTLALGSKEPPIFLFVGGSYESGNWVFSGSSTRIPMDDFCSFTENTFQISPPSFLEELSLEQLKVEITYDGKQKKLISSKFSLRTQFSVGETEIQVSLDIQTTPSTKCKGQILAKNATLVNLVKIFGIENMELPFDLKIESMTLEYDFGTKTLTLQVASETASVKLTRTKDSTLLAIQPKSIKLSEFPLIGTLPPEIAIELSEIAIVYAKGFSVPTTIEGIRVEKNGLDLKTKLKLGNILVDLPKEKKEAKATTSTENKGSVNWISIKKTMGFLHFEKIGLELSGENINICFDVWAGGNGLQLSVLDLKVAFSLTTYKPTLSFNGIAVAYSQGPVTISGGLEGSMDNLSGQLILKTPTFCISALGAYAVQNNQPSLFVFAHLDYPIGGDPSCFIEGLSAGFGYNRELIIPPIEKVAEFPLIQIALGKIPKGGPGAILNHLTTSGAIAPKIGENWLAFGVKLSTYKLIETNALLVLKFGKRFSIDLLGFSSAKLPDRNKPFVVAELQFKGTCIPDEGFVGVQGALTPNSYIFHKNCHLNGGFAYYMWFQGPHAGDFVITLGGYGTKFRPPSHYPKVAPLTLNWTIDSNTSVKGSFYFAQTSKALMAGGNLQAVWQSGWIKAWFGFQADFLMYYDPFQFHLWVHVWLGASIEMRTFLGTVTLSFQLGVDLEIWGPDLCGRVFVDLGICSFSIYFGNDTRKIEALDWNKFSAKYVTKKANTTIFDFNITNGLVKEVKGEKGTLLIVNGEQFEGVILTSIPIKEMKVADLDDKHETNFTVGPSGFENGKFSSHFSVESRKNQLSLFEFKKEKRNVPKSLWQFQNLKESSPQGNPTEDQVIKNTAVGFRFSPKRKAPSKSVSVGDLASLLLSDQKPHEIQGWEKPKPSPRDPNVPSFTDMDREDVKQNRNALLASLSRCFPSLPSNVAVKEYSHSLFANPIARQVGKK